jgi:hypothetical protein
MDVSYSPCRYVRGSMHKDFNLYLDFLFWCSRNDHLQTFSLTCARCFTSPTNRQLLTTLSRTEQSKGCTATSRTPFAHAPPRQLGPRSYLLCSSDSEHSQGKTLVFPRLRQFLALPLCCLMSFYETKKCQLMPLSKFFQKPCMFMLFLCPGTIIAPSCRASCQASSSPPPRLGLSGRRHPTPSAAL